jgi:ferredoxin
MIVAEQKPLDAIRKMLGGYRKVLAVGCGTCVTVCFAGGRNEVGILASSLRMSARLDGAPLRVDETTVQRQCETEYIEVLGERVADCDAILSLGCGVGVQSLAEQYPDTPVFPALDTKFMGAPTELGVWEERCQGCGNCILGLTGGICPISRCAKQLMNGPCGGSQGGHCEVDPGIPCAWQLIWERMGRLGRIDHLMRVAPPKDWSKSRDGGPRRVVREDLRVPKAEGS